MSFRFRPSFEILEVRENPSTSGLVDSTGTPIDPNQIGNPPPGDTVIPPPGTSDGGGTPRG